MRAFLVVAEKLNFTKAGEELGISKSMVSKWIKLYEKQLGVRLFNRHTRYVGLTDAGRKLLPEIESALDAIDQGHFEATGRA